MYQQMMKACVVLIVCMPEVPFLNLATFSLEERYMYFCPPIFAPLVLKFSCPDWLKLVIKVLRSAGSTLISFDFAQMFPSCPQITACLMWLVAKSWSCILLSQLIFMLLVVC